MRTKIISTIATLLLLAFTAAAQDDVTASLNSAGSSYGSGDLENARFELQEALNGVNRAIGEAILGILPASMGGMESIPESDDVMGTNMGFAGLSVSREYEGEGRNATFNIVSDSPLLSAVSSLLSMSVFIAADPNQKRIKIDGYKALMSRSEDDEGGVSYNLQLPFGSSLMTFDCYGVADEDEFVKLAEMIPVGDIVDIAQ